MKENDANSHLRRTLGPLMLWGLGVGYVISGMYFGWNLGLAEGGTLGLALATLLIILMYVTFTFSYAELASAIPDAGGAFAYADRSLGKKLGFICGMAQIIEFTFAPPAIAAAIGAYLHIFLPSVPVIAIAIVAYFIFTLLNISGIKAAASFELIITMLAVVELLIFAGAALPHFELENLQANAFPNGVKGIFAAIPFAIWFFLGIEGLANVAEETVNPQRNILIGFGSAISTLVVLCVLTFASAVGVGGWEAVVYTPTGETSDSPLPAALALVTGSSNVLYHLLITVGLFGLVASFHGIILAAGRATFEFGRVGYIPQPLGRIHPKFKTPANALVLNMLIGIVALITGKTGEIITISCLGALTLYILSMLSLLVLRKKEPALERPFRVPAYPWFPVTALLIALIALGALIVFNFVLALIYFTILGAAYLAFVFFYREKKPIEERQ
jgi:ethanolamine permease